ncbi:MAG TPA: thioredoxin family protein [Xanthomonadaceae bacterium]|nr:thioredoxin family protein [Xanthomonadaceae bacterium]
MALLVTPEPVMGIRAHPFRLPDIDRRMTTLEDVRGERGTLLMFICNHCPYVQAIRPRLVADCRELKAEGIGVVAINPNDPHQQPEDSPDRMRQVAQEFDFPFPYLFDGTQETARAYGAVCTPDFFGYDSKLQLQYRGRLDPRHRDARQQGDRRELVEAMREIAATGLGPIAQHPSMGCSIKWTR